MYSNNHVAYPKEHIRYAVLSFFLAQGLCFSSWASRIPDIKELFTVNDALYWGMVLFMIPVGKFIAIPLAGYLVSKLGSRIMVQISIMGYALSLFAIGTAVNIYMLGICLFSFGVFWNLCDISLNTQGIGIERFYGRTIMASFHGGWSLAACMGALIGFGYHSFLAFYDDCGNHLSYNGGKPEISPGRYGSGTGRRSGRERRIIGKVEIYPATGNVAYQVGAGGFICLDSGKCYV